MSHMTCLLNCTVCKKATHHPVMGRMTCARQRHACHAHCEKIMQCSTCNSSHLNLQTRLPDRTKQQPDGGLEVT